jgi:LemA protein
MQYEKNLLTEISNIRTKAMGTSNTDVHAKLDKELNGLLKSLMISVENYPDLKASGNFLNLQQSINETEDQIAAARRAYNASVIDFNNALEMFPWNIIASMMGLSKAQVFEVSTEERKNPDIKGLFKR